MLNTTQQNVLSTLVAEGTPYADAYVAALGVGSATPFDEAMRTARIGLRQARPARRAFPTDPTDYGFLHTGFLKVRAAAASASASASSSAPSGTGTD